MLVKNKIAFESSCPSSTAERGWRSIFDMARCLLIESKLQETLWTYAVMATDYIRNRCYHQRIKQTPVFMLTGKVPNVSKLHVFGSVCYAYTEINKKKLDPRSKKGVFLGYDQYSPAYLVYDPKTEKVSKHRCVKFTEKYEHEVVQPSEASKPKPSVEFAPPEDNTYHYNYDDDDYPSYKPLVQGVQQNGAEINNENNLQINNNDEDTIVIEDDDHDGDNAENPAVENDRYPRRRHNLPGHLNDYVVGETSEEDTVMMVDCCYNASSVTVPKTYREAVRTPQANSWKAAMDDEMSSLNENDTYTLVELPRGKNCIGGRWVYSVKAGPEEEEVFKARYVAKGFRQEYGSDYFDTFAPTAKITTLRIFLQIAVQFDLEIHQLDVRTAYLNAPIDVEIYVEQPEGYEQNSTESSGKIVWHLHRSLYGLKQSGRNWNKLLHQFMIENSFVQSKCDACVYMKYLDSGMCLVLIWVDDILTAANTLSLLNNTKDLFKNKFKMKDLGPIDWFLGIKFEQKQGVI